LKIVAVHHLATKNHLTVRARIYVKRFDNEMFFFDAYVNIWDLQHTLIKPESLKGIEIIETPEAL